MSERWDVIVVGAGICGLGAAYELARRGARVLVLERVGVGADQSSGLGRIFRIAHREARLCALAVEARALWNAWTEQLDAGRLLGDEGFVVSGPDVLTERAAAMREAGADAREIDGAELVRRVPHVAADHPWSSALLDPLGGSVRVRRTLDALAARLDIRRAEVVAAADDPSRGDAAVRLSDGTVQRAGQMLICAGTRTPELAATAGIPLTATFTHHVRLTYARREPAAPTACLSVGESYGLPLGSTGHWGLGLDDPGPPEPWRTSDPDAYAAAVRAQHAEWVPRFLPGLDPTPLDEIRCVTIEAPWIRHDDGFAAMREGRVTAFLGSNLMKFGPLLADRLARTVLDPQLEIDSDLRPPAAT